jgi:hypothetical protein
MLNINIERAFLISGNYSGKTWKDLDRSLRTNGLGGEMERIVPVLSKPLYCIYIRTVVLEDMQGLPIPENRHRASCAETHLMWLPHPSQLSFFWPPVKAGV